MERGIAQVKMGDPLNGALELISLNECGAPAPPYHVRVRLTHRPINPSDHNSIAMGRLFNLEQSPPIPGCEGCGIVHEVGEGVTKFKVGERVIPLIFLACYKTGRGSWQDFITLPENHIMPIPRDVPDEVAAQSVINPWTAYGLLKDSAVPPGEYILQTAAASVLGRQLIQLAKHWGIKTINIVRRAKWVEELKALGADEVINSETQDITSCVTRITRGKLAYAALDAVGGTLTKEVASSVRNGGMVVVYGVLSGWDMNLRTVDLMRGVNVRWWLLSNFVNSDEKLESTAKDVVELLHKKIMTPLIGKTFLLADFKDALIESKQAGRGGKVLLGS